MKVLVSPENKHYDCQGSNGSPVPICCTNMSKANKDTVENAGIEYQAKLYIPVFLSKI